MTRIYALVREFDKDRLVVRSCGLGVHLDAANPATQIFRREDEIAAVRAVRPLHAIV